MRLYPQDAMQETFASHSVLAEADPDWLKQLVLHHLAPGLGCVIAFIMFFSPFQAIQQVRKQKHLGDFNPLPLVAIVANTLVWLVYGSITRDIYVIMANEPGLLIGVYMTVSAYGFASEKGRDTLLKAMLFFATLISVTSCSISLFLADHAQQVSAAGWQAVGVLLIFYSAPLSALAQVFKTRSSASLYWPLSVMSVVNGSLWVAYGLAVVDPFIWAPNAVGAFFGILQLVLIAIFPKTPSAGAKRAAAAAALQDDALSAPLTAEQPPAQ